MCVLLITRLLRLVGRWARKPVNHTSWVALVTPTDRPKSVRNCCLIERFCGVVCVVTCPFDISVGVGAFVIGLGQISSFLSLIVYCRALFLIASFAFGYFVYWFVRAQWSYRIKTVLILIALNPYLILILGCTSSSKVYSYGTIWKLYPPGIHISTENPYLMQPDEICQTCQLWKSK